MYFYVDYSCEDNNETGRTKLTVSDFDTTSIRDVKYAIQAAIQAPICDQQLFYQGQPVTDDDMTLSRLYFREGDCFKVQFLATADIARMSELVDVLKTSAQEIVENPNSHLQVINTKYAPDSLTKFSDFFNRLKSAGRAMLELTNTFFSEWRSLRTVAQRHFFVQEGGFDAWLEVFKFLRRLHHDFNVNGISAKALKFLDHPKYHFNQGQLCLQSCCLGVLWNFGETPQDLKFLLSKDVFPLVVDALLLQPYPLEDTGHGDIGIIVVNEKAIGCFAALVEYDVNIQEEVSKMSPLIDKLVFMTDRYQSEIAGYSLHASKIASTTLFICTFNVKSAKPLLDCRALEKMLIITKRLLIDKDSNAALLRYFSCLFLARMRSAPLVKLDSNTCVAIDEVIELFLNNHVPDEISRWEEEVCSIWITIVPLVHLAFAAGKEYYCTQIKVLECDEAQIEEAYLLESKQSKASITEVNEAEASSSDNREEKHIHRTSCKRKTIKSPTLSDVTSGSVEAEISVAGDRNCVMAGRKDQFTWPGSASTQKLGIFSLMHVLSFRENQQLALAENLLPYLVCLSWHLKCDEKEKLKTSLANFQNVSSPPSLKVAAKSVLALVNGLDMVFNL